MVCATFRFYGELNDFLPRERRGREIATPCARMATTKHMIEALGVPHTEVELVLVNGEAAGLDSADARHCRRAALCWRWSYHVTPNRRRSITHD